MSQTSPAVAVPPTVEVSVVIPQVHQERIAHHVNDLVEQAEAAAQAEREREHDERRQHHGALMGAMSQLTQAVGRFVSGHGEAQRQLETLQAEVKTLRAAILLAHSIGGEADASSPQSLNVVRDEKASSDPFDAFPIPLGNGARAHSTRSGDPQSSEPQTGEPRRKRVMSQEARARISAAQKARWARRRGEPQG